MGHKIRQDHRTASLTTPDIYFGLLTIIVLILLNADQCLLLAVAFYLVLSTLLHPISKETI